MEIIKARVSLEAGREEPRETLELMNLDQVPLGTKLRRMENLGKTIFKKSKLMLHSAAHSRIF